MTTQQFGHLYGTTHTFLVNATDLKSAVGIYIKRIMKMPENNPIKKEDGTIDFKATLQQWVNDYGKSVIDIAQSDGYDYKPIVCMADAADCIRNTYGWITLNRTSVDNRTIYNEIIALMNRWGIKDYEDFKVA